MDAESSQASNSQTILSVVQDFASHDAFSQPLSPVHPFSSDPETSVNMIKSLLDVTAQISGSLNAQITLPFSNPKLISLFKQQTVISHTVHNVSLMPPTSYLLTYTPIVRLIKQYDN